MKQCMDSENLHRRLKKIIGQVQAIDRAARLRQGGPGRAYQALRPGRHRARRRRQDHRELHKSRRAVFKHGIKNHKPECFTPAGAKKYIEGNDGYFDAN